MEAETSDELARLWQSFTVPPRLSAVYKVSVVLISPEATIGPTAPRPSHVSVIADPSVLPYAAGGQVLGTARTYRFRKPDGTLSDPVDLAPATAVPNQPFFLYGAGLNQATSNRVYLTLPGNVEVDVTAWLAGPPAIQTDSRLTLLLPNAIGVPPAATPAPGIYQLSVGDALTVRSNSTPFCIAPRIDVTLNPPILPAPFTFNGAGFIPGLTQVLLDAVPLAPGPPAAGFFQVNGAGTQIDFQAPVLPAGRYTVRVRVNQVEADPSWWIKI
jgi:hypothetical protein